MALLRFVLLFLLVFSNVYCTFPKETIIEEQDFKYFNDFIKHHFYRDNFAYTLFGDKPLSLGAFALVEPVSVINPLFLHFNSISLKRWETWKKYAKYFPMRNYLLFEQDGGDNRKFIFFINKLAFVSCVKNHQAIFDKELGKKVEGEQLLLDFAEGKTPLWKNQLLLGILLGYGECNARLFAERAKIEELSLLFGDISSHKYHKINESLGLFKEGQIVFAADLNHPETMALKQKYRKLTKEIAEKYALRNFLKVTLQKLIQ